jgi:GT2 family glycosyltransferase
MIGAVLLRYNGDPTSLEAAVASVVSSVGAGSEAVVGDVVLVDNASTFDPGAVDRVAAKFKEIAADGLPLVRSLYRSGNDGFATGVNAGIASLRATCETVLLLNDDAYLDPSALGIMLETLNRAAAEVISVAPKMLIEGEDGLIDSVGMAANRKGEAKNLGLGQLDLGQFDHDHEVFGPCFGAALIRRSAFAPDVIGPLREDYFMYYEDVEWNWRAQRLGWRSVAVPKAHVWHRMSASSRADDTTLRQAERSYERKHRCIERNLLATGVELLPAGDAIRMWTHRWPRLVKGGVTGRFPKASLLASIEALFRLPRTLIRRKRLAAKATGDAQSPLAFWTPEPIMFDPVTYAPQRSWQGLATAARLAGYDNLSTASVGQDRHEVLRAAQDLPPRHQDHVVRYVNQLTKTS